MLGLNFGRSFFILLMIFVIWIFRGSRFKLFRGDPLYRLWCLFKVSEHIRTTSWLKIGSSLFALVIVLRATLNLTFLFELVYTKEKLLGMASYLAAWAGADVFFDQSPITAKLLETIKESLVFGFSPSTSLFVRFLMFLTCGPWNEFLLSVRLYRLSIVMVEGRDRWLISWWSDLVRTLGRSGDRAFKIGKLSRVTYKLLS